MAQSRDVDAEPRFRNNSDLWTDYGWPEQKAQPIPDPHSPTCWLRTDQPGNPVNGLRICTCAASLTDREADDGQG